LGHYFLSEVIQLSLLLQDATDFNEIETMRSTPIRTARRRVLDAYRETHAQNAALAESDDGSWLPVGSLLEHASLVPEADRGPILAAVRENVLTSIGRATWDAGNSTDPSPPRDDDTLEGRMRSYCDLFEEAGALDVADAILVAFVAADHAISSLERGRIEAARARLAWKRGDLEVASERYRRVTIAARKEHSDELRVRAWNGEAIVARLRGNYPRCRALGEKAAALADEVGLMRLASLAHHTLMVAEAVRGAFPAAIDHGWQAYIRAEGDCSLESAALGNMGQVFLDAGHPETAVAAFAAVMRREPPNRVLLPALGGLAVAAARLHSVILLHTATSDILRRAELLARSAPYDLATAMLDLTEAHAIIGDASSATAFRRRTALLAEAHGFHEIAIRAERLPDVPAPAPLQRVLSSRAEAVAGRVRCLVSL
jgi:tetratricopeptide (TPR) repeat protein